MRVFSNLLLNAAVATRRFPRLFQKCLDAAFTVRKWELRAKPDPKLDALFEAAEQRETFNAALRGAVRAGLVDVRRGLLEEGFSAVDIPLLASLGKSSCETPVKKEEFDEGGAVSQRSLSYAILWGTDEDRKAAESQWKERFPGEPIPVAMPECFVPTTFERVTANGSFKVTPELRAKVKKLVKRSGKCDLLVVVNKTNTAISLGIGQLGDKGGVELPVSGEPFVLTDHYSIDEWVNSPDFRRAVARDWIVVLAASPRPKFLKASPKDVTR